MIKSFTKIIYASCFIVLSVLLFGCSLNARQVVVPPTGPRELIPYGDFEMGPSEGLPPKAGPRTIGNGEVSIVDTVARSGNYSLYVAERKGGTNGFGFNDPVTGGSGHSVKGGKTYQISFWYKIAEGMTTGKILMFRIRHSSPFLPEWIHPFDENGKFSIRTAKDNAHLYIDAFASEDMDPDVWYPVSVTVTIPSNATWIVNFYNESSTYPVWIDDVSIIELD